MTLKLAASKIILHFVAVFFKVARFIAVIAYGSLTYSTKNHWGWPFVLRITKLRYISVIYLLSTTNIITMATITIIVSTKITRLLHITMVGQHTTVVSHISLMCSFCEQYHIIKSIWSMHKNLSSYMGFKPM